MIPSEGCLIDDLGLLRWVLHGFLKVEEFLYWCKNVKEMERKDFYPILLSSINACVKRSFEEHWLVVEW